MLRDYQQAAVARLREAFRRGRKRLLLVAPTGSGKTIIAAHMVERAVAKGGRVLFVAHRGELIQQTCNKLDAAGVPHGVIWRNHARTNPHLPVQVATIQTLVRRDPPDASLVIFDEAHLSMADSFKSIADRYVPRGAALIGLTATPIRLDGKPLGDLYEELVEVETVAGLIERGFLVPIRHYAPEVPDLTGVSTRGGDYAEEQLERMMNQSALNTRLLESWFSLANGRPTVVFSVSIEHSRAIVAEFARAGIPAEHIDGTMPMHQRNPIYARLREGRTRVVSNVGVLCEGWDEPSVSCAILARPTKSVALYLQQAGRVLRPSPGKPDAVIIDLAGCGVAYGRPDMRREWVLERNAKTRKARQQDRTVQTLRCDDCYTVFPGDAPACPVCGWVPKREGRQLEDDHSRLTELTREKDVALEAERAARRREVAQSRTLEDLVRLGTQRGYKSPFAWAQHVIRARGGHR